MNNLRQREISQIAAESVSSPAIEHAALAEMSNMAIVAASRLQTGRAPSAEDLRIVLGLLRTSAWWDSSAGMVRRRITNRSGPVSRDDTHLRHVADDAASTRGMRLCA
jgi:hypothetical protein